MRQKQNLRRQMRALRAALEQNARQRAAQQIHQRLCEIYRRENWPAVALYLATSDELNLDEFIAWLLARDVKVYAPRGETLALLDTLANVTISKFGVREPQETGGEFPPHNVVLLVPALAFDERGARLGFGGGWYDRALTHFPHSLKIGVAFDFQIVSEVPREAHDVAMNCIVTPSAFIKCKLK